MDYGNLNEKATMADKKEAFKWFLYSYSLWTFSLLLNPFLGFFYPKLKGDPEHGDTLESYVGRAIDQMPICQFLGNPPVSYWTPPMFALVCYLAMKHVEKMWTLTNTWQKVFLCLYAVGQFAFTITVAVNPKDNTGFGDEWHWENLVVHVLGYLTDEITMVLYLAFVLIPKFFPGSAKGYRKWIVMLNWVFFVFYILGWFIFAFTWLVSDKEKWNSLYIEHLDAENRNMTTVLEATLLFHVLLMWPTYWWCFDESEVYGDNNKDFASSRVQHKETEKLRV